MKENSSRAISYDSSGKTLAAVQALGPAVECGSGGDVHTAVAASVVMTGFGIPLTGSMSAGFTIGFIKG